MVLSKLVLSLVPWTLLLHQTEGLFLQNLQAWGWIWRKVCFCQCVLVFLQAVPRWFRKVDSPHAWGVMLLMCIFVLHVTILSIGQIKRSFWHNPVKLVIFGSTHSFMGRLERWSLEEEWFTDSSCHSDRWARPSWCWSPSGENMRVQKSGKRGGLFPASQDWIVLGKCGFVILFMCCELQGHQTHVH